MLWGRLSQMADGKALTFGPLIVGAGGIRSIHRSPDKVIYVRWGDEWPTEPPSAENWLVPHSGETIRVMGHPRLGFILFCILLPGREMSHASLVSKLVNEFDLPLPHYGEWVRFDSRHTAKRGHYIKIDSTRLPVTKEGFLDLRTGFRDFGTVLRRLRTLKAVPADYPIQMELKRGKIIRSTVQEWCDE